MLPKGEKTLFVFFLFDLMGIGLRGRNILHWFLLVLNLLQRVCRIYLRMKSISFSLISISFLMRDANSLLLFVISLIKVQSMRELFTLTPKISRKHYILLRIVDAGTFFLLLTFVGCEIFLVGLDNCIDFNELWHKGNSTVMVVIQRTICLNDLILMHDSHSFCALYILIFTLIFLVKVQHLNSMSSNLCGWRGKMLTVSSQVSDLSDKLDTSTSFILFCRAVYQFFLVLLVFFLVMLLSEKNFTRPGDGHEVLLYKLFVDLFLTALLFIAISLMQETIQDKCDSLSRKIVYSAYASEKMHEKVVLANILTSDFTQKVTVWKLVEVSRTIVLTLASVYFAFPVLLWQVNNGAMGTLRAD